MIAPVDLPLNESSRILVQTGTTYHPDGWEHEQAQYVQGDDTLQGYTIFHRKPVAPVPV